MTSTNNINEVQTINTVNVTIDGMKVNVPEDWSVFKACQFAGVKVPNLCHHPRLPPAGKCGVCVVEIEGEESPFKLSCSTKVVEGMSIKTNTPAVKQRAALAIRRVFAKQAPPQAQRPENPSKLVSSLLDFSENALKDDSSFALVRDMGKCIGCTRCARACSSLQGVGVLEPNMDPDGIPLLTTDNLPLFDTDCVSCGQCAAFCPVGAIVEKDHIAEVEAALRNPNLTVVLETAPAPRVALSECLGKPPGEVSTGKMVAAARKLGFKFVFDTNFSADLTIMEEGSELLERLDNGGPFPLFTSCCPGWVNFVEKRVPKLRDKLSTCRSPMMMLGPLIKTYWAKRVSIDPDKIFVVALMPCTAKKDEIERPQMWRNGKKDVDAVLTTREFGSLIHKNKIVWDSLADEEFNDPLGQSTGAAALFGVTGGVMEAALRTAYELKTKQTLKRLTFQECRGLSGVKEAEVKMDGATVRVAIVNGLQNTQALLKKIENQESFYHFVEVMACPSGCIGGGGQPLSEDEMIMEKRAAAIYGIDERSVIRKSHENPSISELYGQFLGHPLSEKAEELLHTSYRDRSKTKLAQAQTKVGGDKGGILVLYGSQGGNTTQRAKDFTERAKKSGLSVRLNQCNSLEPNDLDKEQNVLIFCSTYGEGDYPDNARKFARSLSQMDGKETLSSLNYALCGFGSSAYMKFCNAPKALDKKLKDLGAQPLTDTVYCDEKSPGRGEEEFEEFTKKMIELLGGSGDAINEIPAPRYSVAMSVGGKRMIQHRPCPPGFHFCHLKTNKLISYPGYARPVRYFEIDLTGSTLTYNVGDHAYILPRNDSEKVSDFLEWYGLSGDIFVSIVSLDGSPSEMPPVMSLQELFEQYMDVFSPVSRKFLCALYRFATDPREREELKNILSEDNKSLFATVCAELQHDEALKRWKSALPPLECLISILPRIRPRAYSIASSASEHPDTVQLMVVLDQWKKGAKCGQGLCSHYLFNLDDRQLPKVAVQIRTGILLPPANTKDVVVMIGLGTGVAPFRGFLQERDYLQKQGASLGPCLFYLGCRYHEKGDYVFKEEWEDYLHRGILTELVNAFSHDQAYFIFVQDKIRDDPQTAFKYISSNDAHIYYCGIAMNVPEEIMASLKGSLIKAGGMNEDQATSFIQRMQDQKRISIESF